MKLLFACVLMLAAVFGTAGAHAAGKSHTVRMEGIKFIPERLEVNAGDTVTWTNKDLVPHTVTAKKLSVESGDIAPSKTWTFTARQKGEIDYICRLHPIMKGVLIVK